LVMALGCWKAFEEVNSDSVYEERGIISLD